MLCYFLCFLFPVIVFLITFSRELLAFFFFFFHSQSPLKQPEETISESVPSYKYEVVSLAYQNDVKKKEIALGSGPVWNHPVMRAGIFS